MLFSVSRFLPFWLVSCEIGLICIALSVYAPRDLRADQTNAATTQPDLGPNASLHGRQVFPADNLWNRDVSNDQVDPNSDNIIAGIGTTLPLHPNFGPPYQGRPLGIPYIVVGGDQPKVPVTFANPGESDPGPYPIPPEAPIEGGSDSNGDRHVLVIDRDHWILYEMWTAMSPDGGKSWTAGAGAIFNLNSNQLRPDHWTSADAAGLPIFPGLVRYDEVVEIGRISHALRFTVEKTRAAFISPARHYASSSFNPKLPPMGMRVRSRLPTSSATTFRRTLLSFLRL